MNILILTHLPIHWAKSMGTIRRFPRIPRSWWEMFCYPPKQFVRKSNIFGKERDILVHKGISKNIKEYIGTESHIAAALFCFLCDDFKSRFINCLISRSRGGHEGKKEGEDQGDHCCETEEEIMTMMPRKNQMKENYFCTVLK